jgi:hypothetical protein
MGGFLSGLSQLLGGWNQVRRIDDTGFDWREQDAAKQFERDRRTQLAGQEDEDRAVNIGRDVMLGAEEGEEPDLSGVLPGYDQGLAKLRVKGAVAQSRPALQAQQSYARLAQEQARGTNQREAIGARGNEAQELVELQAKLRSGAPMTEYQRRSLEQRAQAIEAMGARGTRRRVLKTPGQRNGVAGTVLYDQDTMDEVGFEAAPQTAATRGKEEAKGAAMVAYESIRGLREQLPTPENWMEAGAVGIGRQVGAMTQANPVANRYKASIRGFVPLMARALGHVGVLTELDVERTEALFSGLGATAETDRISDEMMRGIMTGQVPFQFSGKGKPIGYIDEEGNFTPMGGAAQPQFGGSAPRPPSGPRERMVKYKGQTVPLSSLPPELQARVPR